MATFQRVITVQKASPSGLEELMDDGANVGADPAQFVVAPGDVFNVTSVLVVTERSFNSVTRFRIRKAGNLPLSKQKLMLLFSIDGPTTTEYGLSQPRPLPEGTYSITVEEPGAAPKAFAALQLVGAGNARL